MLPSGLPEQVADDEDLARFITSSRLIRRGVAKPAAFLPNPNTRNTSVFRHGLGNLSALWAISEELIAGTRNIHGVAIVRAGRVRDAGLDALAQEPPPRHANIVGWPAEGRDPQLSKAQRKERALVLSSAAEVRTP